MIDPEARKQAMSVMLREHLAELRDWYVEDDKNDSHSEVDENSGSASTTH